MVLTRRTLGPLSSLLIAAGLVACGGRSATATDGATEAEARDAGTGMDGLVGSLDSTDDEAASPTNGEGPGANDASAAVAEDETGGETGDRSSRTSSGEADGADSSVDASVGSEPSDEPLDDDSTDDGLSATDDGRDLPGATDDAATDDAATDEGTTDEGTTDEGTTDEGTTDEGTTDPAITDVPDGGGTDDSSTNDGVTDDSSTDDDPPPDGTRLAPDCEETVTYDASPSEIAEALADLLWDTVPDAQLNDAVADGQLSNSEQVAVQVERMLSSPQAVSHLGGFGDWWFGERAVSSKDPTRFPFFDAQLGEDMRSANRRFFESLIQEGETLGTLLTASYGFVNERLGQVYGVDIPGEEFVRVALDPSTRAGAFTQPYFLSVASNYDRTSPTLRGKLLEELLMCAAVPAPPPDIGLTPPTRDDVSNRQAYEIELADPACAACHALITYPGFIFENYDAIGSYQTTDNGFAVDASTDIYVDGEFVAYENAVAMMPDLAEREVVSSCVALNWVTYLVGRRSREAISGVGSREIESCGGGDACVRGSIAEYAAEIAQCAGAPGADMNLPDLAGRLAASPLLLAGTIACGDKRCFAEFEECVITENVAAGAPDYACLPATGP